VHRSFCEDVKSLSRRFLRQLWLTQSADGEGYKGNELIQDSGSTCIDFDFVHYGCMKQIGSLSLIVLCFSFVSCGSIYGGALRIENRLSEPVQVTYRPVKVAQCFLDDSVCTMLNYRQAMMVYKDSTWANRYLDTTYENYKAERRQKDTLFYILPKGQLTKDSMVHLTPAKGESITIGSMAYPFRAEPGLDLLLSGMQVQIGDSLLIFAPEILSYLNYRNREYWERFDNILIDSGFVSYVVRNRNQGFFPAERIVVLGVDRLSQYDFPTASPNYFIVTINDEASSQVLQYVYENGRMIRLFFKWEFTGEYYSIYFP